MKHFPTCASALILILLAGWGLSAPATVVATGAPIAGVTPLSGDDLWADDFTVPGFHGSVEALALGPDGSIYVGGSFDRAGGVPAKRLARWQPGSGWVEVGGGVNESVYALAVGPDGKLYVGGWFTQAGGSTPVGHVAMWDGAAWSDMGGGVSSPGLANIYDFHFDAAGAVYVAGDFRSAGGNPANYIARWDGAAWSTLGSGLNSTVFALDMDAQGNLYVGGFFSTAGGNPARSVAKWDGGAWSALGSGLNERVFDLAVDASGNVAVVGGFTQAGGQPARSAAYWHAATSTWSSMDGGAASGWADAVLIDPVGSVYVGGRFIQIGGVAAAHIARWDGSVWSPLGSGMNPRENLPGVKQMAFATDGTLVAIGAFNTAGGINANGLARWDGARWTTIGRGVDNTLGSLYVDGEDLYAGVILASGENVDSYLLQWNGVGWTEWGGATSGSVYDITADNNGHLYIGGSFTRVAYHSAAPIEAYNIAMWDGANWSSLNGGTGVYGKPIHALATDNQGRLYAGGEFSTIGGVAADNIAVWDGSAWSPLGSGVNGRVYALLWDSNGLYAAGAFTQAGGAGAKYVAHWDGATWTPLGTGTSDVINALALGSDGLYVGGQFTHAGGKLVNNIARWWGGEWFPLGDGTNNRVASLAMGPDNALYAGGQFTQAGGQPASGIARWQAGGWSALGSGVEATVNTLAFDPDGNLYLGGYFTTAGGKASSHIAYARLAGDLRLTKSTTPVAALPGERITYTLVLRNTGVTPAVQVVLSDTVPANATLDPASLSGDAAVAGGVITWNTGADLAPGQAITRTFQVIPAAGPAILNRANASAANLTRDAVSNGVQNFVAPGVTGDVGPAGGAMTYTDDQGNPTTVQAPAGAVDQPAILVFSPLSYTTPPAGWVFAGHAFNLNALRNGIRQWGFTFLQPVNIIIIYSAADIVGLNRDSLALRTWDEVAGQWEDAACGPVIRTPATNSITTPVCHLSSFALFGQAAESERRLYLPLVLRAQ